MSAEVESQHDGAGRRDQLKGKTPVGYGWLCPTEGDRARMLDMGPRVKRARTIAAAAVGVGLLAASDEVGWPALLLFALAIVNLATLDRRMQTARRPEHVVAGSVLLILALMGVAGALADGGVSPLLGLVVIPVAASAARFRAPVVWAVAGIAALVALAAAVISDAQRAIDHPLNLTIVFVLLVGVTAVTTALMDAELQFRSESVLDPLTGLLNRKGLEARFAEIAGQARLDSPVCLVMCDLDNFKQVNDDHGHERGDAVLRDVSYEMRKSLRSFELIYRLGGEEFLVLLPGIDLPRGIEIAETLRVAVGRTRSGPVAVTASFGVSVATRQAIEFGALYRAADDALYRAKDAGRNVVVGSALESASQDQSLPGPEPFAFARL
jgi:diguanylate cyclase (GGDEF)-like protein